MDRNFKNISAGRSLSHSGMLRPSAGYAASKTKSSPSATSSFGNKESSDDEFHSLGSESISYDTESSPRPPPRTSDRSSRPKSTFSNVLGNVKKFVRRSGRKSSESNAEINDSDQNASLQDGSATGSASSKARNFHFAKTSNFAQSVTSAGDSTSVTDASQQSRNDKIKLTEQRTSAGRKKSTTKEVPKRVVKRGFVSRIKSFFTRFNPSRTNCDVEKGLLNEAEQCQGEAVSIEPSNKSIEKHALSNNVGATEQPREVSVENSQPDDPIPETPKSIKDKKERHSESMSAQSTSSTVSTSSSTSSTVSTSSFTSSTVSTSSSKNTSNDAAPQTDNSQLPSSSTEQSADEFVEPIKAVFLLQSLMEGGKLRAEESSISNYTAITHESSTEQEVPSPFIRDSTRVSFMLPTKQDSTPAIAIPVLQSAKLAPKVETSTSKIDTRISEIEKTTNVETLASETKVSAPNTKTPTSEIEKSTPKMETPIPEIKVPVPVVELPTSNMEMPFPKTKPVTPIAEGPTSKIATSKIETPTSKIEMPTAIDRQLVHSACAIPCHGSGPIYPPLFLLTGPVVVNAPLYSQSQQGAATTPSAPVNIEPNLNLTQISSITPNQAQVGTVPAQVTQGLITDAKQGSNAMQPQGYQQFSGLVTLPISQTLQGTRQPIQPNLSNFVTNANMHTQEVQTCFSSLVTSPNVQHSSQCSQCYPLSKRSFDVRHPLHKEYPRRIKSPQEQGSSDGPEKAFYNRAIQRSSSTSRTSSPFCSLLSYSSLRAGEMPSFADARPYQKSSSECGDKKRQLEADSSYQSFATAFGDGYDLPSFQQPVSYRGPSFSSHPDSLFQPPYRARRPASHFSPGDRRDSAFVHSKGPHRASKFYASRPSLPPPLVELNEDIISNLSKEAMVLDSEDSKDFHNSVLLDHPPSSVDSYEDQIIRTMQKERSSRNLEDESTSEDLTHLKVKERSAPGSPIKSSSDSEIFEELDYYMKPRTTPKSKLRHKVDDTLHFDYDAPLYDELDQVESLKQPFKHLEDSQESPRYPKKRSLLGPKKLSFSDQKTRLGQKRSSKSNQKSRSGSDQRPSFVDKKELSLSDQQHSLIDERKLSADILKRPSISERRKLSLLKREAWLKKQLGLQDDDELRSSDTFVSYQKDLQFSADEAKSFTKEEQTSADKPPRTDEKNNKTIETELPRERKSRYGSIADYAVQKLSRLGSMLRSSEKADVEGFAKEPEIRNSQILSDSNGVSEHTYESPRDTRASSYLKNFYGSVPSSSTGVKQSDSSPGGERVGFELQEQLKDPFPMEVPVVPPTLVSSTHSDASEVSSEDSYARVRVCFLFCFFPI